MKKFVNFDNNIRCDPELSTQRVLQDHLSRYNFVTKYTKNKVVLDIACGEGYGSKIIKDCGVAEITGVDNDIDILNQAKVKYPGIKFIAAEATETPLADNYFDVVVSFETWHHLDNYQKFAAEIYRILKPNGLFVLSVPNKKIIYLNPFTRKFLTKYYYYNFNCNKLKTFLSPYFRIQEWYGQRFVKKIYTFSLVKILLLILSKLSNKINDKVNLAFKRANGPMVMPLNHRPARYLIIVAQKI